ncbi:hypothetical protein ACJX0J_033732, partial [Zea mays]
LSTLGELAKQENEQAFVSFSHLLIQEKMLKMNNVTALPKFSILFSFSNFLRSIILDSYFDFYLVLLGTTSFFLMFVFLILDHDEDIVFPKKKNIFHTLEAHTSP